MLRVENLTKIYKTKKGADVHALDGVTLQFSEKGMVFLLGKSGSGKSTLLNVCGGLDAPTSGEIIVKGRSSKDFSQADFDSYRNTFIGFIFQEYNILNEFSVEDNIALALELQGKSKDKKAIKALLEEVDLQGFAKRKPNTLSGGQKQRIAIARALIKSPEIIMADEPTGALDSNTGKQVLDTLKKLSQNKLVIVVSHDREFAELYGDRIIELKDGKVISDVTKGVANEKALSENINTIGDMLCIKNGSELTESEFEKIKAFLKKSKSDIIIAQNEKDVKNFKKINRINDDGQKEIFADTDESKLSEKEYTKEESRFIRSRLPFRHAFKIGVSSLRLKPIRLLFTILLCTVAFTLLGLLSTLNFYNSEATFKETLSDISISNVQLRKEYLTTTIWYEKDEKRNEYESWEIGKFNNAEIKELAGKFGKDAFGGLNIGGNFNLRVNNSQYWLNSIVAYAHLPENNSLRQSITGTYPKNANEIMITSYIANMFMECQAVDSNSNLIEATDRAQLIGKKIGLQGEAYTITGILETGEVPAEYEPLKTATEEDYNLQSKLRTYFDSSLHGIVFTTEDRIQKLAAQNTGWKESIVNYTRVVSALKLDGKYTYPEYANANYMRPGDLNNGYKLYSPDGLTVPDNNQAFITSEFLGNIVSEAYWKLIENADMNENYELSEKYRKVTEIADQVRNGGVYSWNEADKTDNFTPFTEAQLKVKINELFKAVKRDKVSLKLGIKAYNDNNQSVVGTQNELTVVGVAYKTVASEHSGENSIILNDATFNKLWDEQKDFIDFYGETKTDYVEPENAFYTTAVIPFKYDQAVVDEYWNIYNNEEFDEKATRLGISSSFIYNLQMVDDMVEGLSKVFLYVGLVFALFAALLLSNFISVSISNKKREIGILRAVGARGTDVFKIFFSESFVITAICVALSTIASILVCGLINGETARYIGASLFVFGILSFFIMVLIALVTAIIATFLPVYNAARKKPVDSIRSL
ncbi:MAG: ATP-binding cassette domain-containing protein [Clostridia bacterium]|nr:ATP-binding cassette domain-containing protein [Clostridia bacterium]